MTLSAWQEDCFTQTATAWTLHTWTRIALHNFVYFLFFTFSLPLSPWGGTQCLEMVFSSECGIMQNTMSFLLKRFPVVCLISGWVDMDIPDCWLSQQQWFLIHVQRTRIRKHGHFALALVIDSSVMTGGLIYTICKHKGIHLCCCFHLISGC